MRRALDSVNERILTAVHKRQPDIIAAAGKLPSLVAVSKFKPIFSIIEAYECGQRHFGENYIQELEEKSKSQEIIEKCPDIRFHFIGHLQSNKVNKLVRIRNLHVVETLDSSKLADLADKAYGKYKNGDLSGDEKDRRSPSPQRDLESDRRLKVMVQVNTSDEDQKGGIGPENAPGLVEHIYNNCPHLELVGLMTIGKLGGNYDTETKNQDFLKLYQLRSDICKSLKVEPASLELSMGMSSDFEEAISLGSTSVRVGTLIFGERN